MALPGGAGGAAPDLGAIDVGFVDLGPVPDQRPPLDQAPVDLSPPLPDLDVVDDLALEDQGITDRGGEDAEPLDDRALPVPDRALPVPDRALPVPDRAAPDQRPVDLGVVDLGAVDFGPVDLGAVDFGPLDLDVQICELLSPEDCQLCCGAAHPPGSALLARCLEACAPGEPDRGPELDAGLDGGLDRGASDRGFDAGEGEDLRPPAPDQAPLDRAVRDREPPEDQGRPDADMRPREDSDVPDLYVPDLYTPDLYVPDMSIDMRLDPDMGEALCNAEELLGQGATGADVCARRLRSPMAEFCADPDPSPPTVDEHDYSFGPNINCRGLYWSLPRFVRRRLPNWMRLRGSFKLQLRNQMTITQEAAQCPECLAVDEVMVRNDLSFDFCGVLSKTLPFNELTGQFTTARERQHRLECDEEEGCLLSCGGLSCTTQRDTPLLRIRNEPRLGQFLGIKQNFSFLGFGVEIDCGARLRFDLELSGERAFSEGPDCPDCEHLELNFSASARADVPCRISPKVPGIRVNLGCRRCARLGISFIGHSELNEPASCGDQPSCGEVAVRAEAEVRTECNCVGVGWFKKCFTCDAQVSGTGALGNCQREFYEADYSLPRCRTCRRP